MVYVINWYGVYLDFLLEYELGNYLVCYGCI